jgi:hypothetical protein
MPNVRHAILTTGASRLRPSKLTFPCDTLMRFVWTLDVIFRLAGTWKLFDHFENTTWHIPADCRPEDNNISDLEFVGRHRFSPPFFGRITADGHFNPVDVTLTVGASCQAPRPAGDNDGPGLATDSRQGGLLMTDSPNSTNPRGFPPWRVRQSTHMKGQKPCRKT